MGKKRKKYPYASSRKSARKLSAADKAMKKSLKKHKPWSAPKRNKR